MQVIGSVLGAILAGGMMGHMALAKSTRGAPPLVVASDFGGPYEDAGPPPPHYPPPPYAGRLPPPPPPYGSAPYAPPVLPPDEIDRIVRESGYSPLGAPQQRGAVYTIAVLDRDGEDGRLVIDARSGRIIRFMPAYRYGSRDVEDVNVAYGPPSPLPPLPRPPAGIAQARASVPMPKPRTAGALPMPEKSALVGMQNATIPAAPTAALAAAPPTPVPPVAAQPAVTIQPTQAMPPAQGME